MVDILLINDRDLFFRPVNSDKEIYRLIIVRDGITVDFVCLFGAEVFLIIGNRGVLGFTGLRKQIQEQTGKRLFLRITFLIGKLPGCDLLTKLVVVFLYISHAS